MSVLQSSACFYPLWEIVTPTRSMWESNWGLSLWDKKRYRRYMGWAGHRSHIQAWPPRQWWERPPWSWYRHV